MRYKVITLFLLFLFSTVIASEYISDFKASAETNRVTISWISKSEPNFKTYKILRSNDNRNYIEIKSINAKGPGTQYSFVDENVMFKSSVLYYKIQALDASGNILAKPDPISVLSNTTGMFRTWGAIKAIFR